MGGEEEEWRAVVGWELSYEVSDLGRVRSIPRDVHRAGGAMPYRVPATIYKLGMENGWRTVTLGSRQGRDGRSVRVRVAYLVAEAFTNWNLSTVVIEFANGDSADARLQNLRACEISHPSEQWLPCPGFLGHYEVSDLGRVRSVFREVPYTNQRGAFVRTVRPRVLRPALSGAGNYPRVNLRRGGKQTHTTVHSLVCEAFHGPRPAGHEVRHLDGSRDNARADNLAYGTQQENEQDKYIHGFAKMAGLSVSEAMAMVGRRGKNVPG